jgi:hypothetical protein
VDEYEFTFVVSEPILIGSCIALGIVLYIILATITIGILHRREWDESDGVVCGVFWPVLLFILLMSPIAIPLKWIYQIAKGRD